MIKIIWIVNALLQTGLLALVLWKRAWRQHPAFTVYIAYCCCQTATLMWVALLAQALYFRVDSIGRMIELPIMLAVLLEVFAEVFKPYSSLPKGALKWFMGALAAVIVLTIILAISCPAVNSDRWLHVVRVLNRSTALIFCAAFGFTALFSSYFGIPWHLRTYGIGLGFLLFLCVDLFAASLAVMHPSAMNAVLPIVPMIAFSLAASTWLAYFAKPYTSRVAPTWDQLFELREVARSLRTSVVYAGRHLASKER